jgi:UrcA family protein
MFKTALVAAFASLAIAAGAHAQTVQSIDVNGDSVVRETVKFGDLDVATSAGVKRLAFRIRLAADDVCGGVSPLAQTGVDFQACVDRSVDRAATRLGMPMVADATGRSPANRQLAAR